MSSSDHCYIPDGLNKIKSSTSAIDQKVNMALACIGIPVLELPNGNANVQKYSVLAGDSIEFVHVFQSDANEGLFTCLLSRVSICRVVCLGSQNLL